MIMGQEEQSILSILTIHDYVAYDVLSCSTIFLCYDTSEIELFRTIQEQR